MSKKKHKISDREKNAFPFLEKGIRNRLKDAGAIDMRSNFHVDKSGHYSSLKPIDDSKKIR
jgi:hypothetical protein